MPCKGCRFTREAIRSVSKKVRTLLSDVSQVPGNNPWDTFDRYEDSVRNSVGIGPVRHPLGGKPRKTRK